MKTNDRVVALVSGGLDSAVMACYLADRHLFVLPVFVRCGFTWETAELYHLRRYLKAVARPELEDLVVLDLPMADVLGAHWSLAGRSVPDRRSDDAAVYLPGRNLVLVAKVAVLAAKRDAATIALGLLTGNPFPDATAEFLESMGRAAGLALGRSLAILAPFSQMSKAQVLALGRDLPLELTFSCLSPIGTEPCGECNKCAERERVLAGTEVKVEL